MYEGEITDEGTKCADSQLSAPRHVGEDKKGTSKGAGETQNGIDVVISGTVANQGGADRADGR